MAGDAYDALVEFGLTELLRLRLVRRLLVPAPLVGADFTFTLPAGGTYELLAVYWTFVTSAVVANRGPTVSLQDADSNFLARFGNGAAIVASSTARVSFTAGLGAPIGGGSYAAGLPVPPYVLQAGDKIASQTSSIDVGDQISAIIVTVRDWSPGLIAQQAGWINDRSGAVLATT